jgi:hypothetical protein
MLKALPTRGFTIAAVTYSSGTSARSINLASYSGPTILTVTFAAGAGGRGTSTTVPGLLFTGTFPAGSTIKIVNAGKVYGSGGAGGDGGIGAAAGTAGARGGPAIRFDSSAGMSDSSLIPLTIDNTSGYICGGGGGGGGGGGTTAGGGGGGEGGGGAGGDGGGYGGSGYADGENAGWPDVGTRYSNDGGSGDPFGPAGNGGYGGPWGIDGNSGGSASGAGGAGGAAGKAVDLNGKASLTWIGGNNSTQVKGAVS